MLALLIALLVLLTRLPFTAHVLFQWDSVLYANALEHGFHVDTEIGAERPHPPGSLFYVAIAAFARLAVRDSNLVLVLIAVVASAAAAAIAYLVMRSVAPRPVAAAAALGFAVSPLFWQQSEVALPYTVLALLSTLFAGSFRKVRTGGGASLVAISLAFGLAAGIRPDLPILLGPLWLWMIVPAAWVVRARALAALAIGCAAWLVPSAALSGGLAAYAAAVTGQATHVGTSFSVAARGTSALVDNLAFTVYALGWGLAAFTLVLVLGGGARLLASRGRPGADAAFFALWIVPPAAVYAGLHIGDPGYVLSIVPGLYVLAAAILGRATTSRPGAILAGALAIAGAAVFLFSSSQFSAGAIAAHDVSVSDRVRLARTAYAPSAVTIVAQFDYVLARYYLPEYRTLFVGDAPTVLSRDPRPVTLDPARDAVLVFGATEPLGRGIDRVALTADGALGRVGAAAGATLTAYAVEGR